MTYKVSIILFLALAAWASLPATALSQGGSPANYAVRSGDNLSLIALRFGVTVRELKLANGLDSDLLTIGQKINISRPFHRTRPADLQWNRPCRSPGEVLRPFGTYKTKGIVMPSTGIEVALNAGTRITSPAHGVVRHVGRMDGYGTLVIIEHGGGFATVFSPLEPASIEVRTNQAVLRGDPLGRTAAPEEPGERPFLHLELRQDDKAIDPDRLLR
jgi:murein DD-endopeptidase MepM/ murein hydrolase activator NlpD